MKRREMVMQIENFTKPLFLVVLRPFKNLMNCGFLLLIYSYTNNVRSNSSKFIQISESK